MTSTLVLDGGWGTTREAEHALHEAVARLGLRPVTACTQFLTGPGRVAVTVELESPAPAGLGELADVRDPADAAADPAAIGSSAAGSALAAHRDGSAGRAFIFPGSDELVGVVRVGDLLARTTIGAVLQLGGLPVDPETDLDTQGFVRPVLRGGHLVLLTRPGIGGVVVPFEQPNPTPCCADHS
jgi:hypothetical protein